MIARAHRPTRHTCDHTLVDARGEPMPKTVTFRKVCDGHTQGIFLPSRPEHYGFWSTIITTWKMPPSSNLCKTQFKN